MENKLENIVYSKNVIEFLTVATDYCSFMDKLNEYDRKGFIDRSLKVLPLLYIKAILLPTFTNIDSLEIEKFVTQEEWQYVNNKVAALMNNINNYTEITDPLNYNTDESGLSAISENFADIYQDMKDFISLYQIGTFEIMRDAIFECKTNFEDYWGLSLVNVLKALHFIRYKKGFDNYKPGSSQSNISDSWFIK
ncbi:MAG: DUF5063 domain-containing protein [Chlorobi bacterium]|nr:DUF5063 domain-containing protein [Chlorobiota bacterium]